MNSNDYLKKLEEMAKNLSFINDMHADIMKKLPADKQQEYAKIQADTKHAIDSMKNGDTKALTKLQKEYANKNS